MDDDGDDKDDTKRRTRNLSEKKRRDQFNLLVTELANLITNNSRKMDKSSILKSTISFLRNYNEKTVRSRAHDVQEDWKPAFLSNEEFTYLVLEALEAFVMVFSASGRIYYASDSILSLLGHKPADLVNKSIYDITYEEDRPILYNMMQKKCAMEHRGHNSNKEKEIMRFQIHIRRGMANFKKDYSYDLVQFYGHFRSKHDQDEDAEPMNFESRVLFVCIGRLQTPLLVRDVSLVDTSRNEFTSRHSLEWKFLFLDHRAPPIIGYLPFEVLGTSGYDYYHFDDLEKVVSCHEELMEKGELTSCHYRFLTKGQQWIWLQSRFYITYHQWNSKPEFVVCTHRVVSYDDVVKTKIESLEYERNSETETNPNNMNDTASDDLMPMSPSYLSKSMGDSYSNSFQPISQPASVKSGASASSTTGTINTAATTGASWPRAHHRYHHDGGGTGTDTASLSGESRTSHRNSERESYEPTEPSLAPHCTIGAQYLDPSVFNTTLVDPPVMISTMPVQVSQDQAQIQLQKKHEELQQMIMRQQEELRRVKEQLLMARFGILQPIVNVQSPYPTQEDMQNQQRMSTQLEYANTPQPIAGYAHHVQLPPQPSHSTHATHPPSQSHGPQSTRPSHPPHPSHPTHPPHPPETHQRMPQ